PLSATVTSAAAELPPTLAGSVAVTVVVPRRCAETAKVEVVAPAGIVTLAGTPAIDAFDEARTRSTGAEGAGERVAVMFALVPGIIRSVAGASVTTIEPAGVVDAVTTGLSSLVTTFGLSS